MSDDVVGVLLRAEADRLSAGVQAPPLDLLTARRPRRLMPVAAAAAVVLVAGIAFAATQAVHHESGPVPITQVGAIVPYDKNEASSAFGDVPAPISSLTPHGRPDYASDPNGHCSAAAVTGSLDLADGPDAGRLRLQWTAGNPDHPTCRLADGVPTVSLYDDSGAELVTSTSTTQPPVVNPPDTQARYLDDKARPTGFTWPSNCGRPAARAVVKGLTDDPISVPVAGTQPTCDGTTATPRLALFGGDGIAPADREGLRVRLLPVSGQPVPAASVVTFVAEFANPTRKPISLTPCPTWLLETEESVGPPGTPHGSSSGRSSRAPCDQLPGQVASGAAVRFELQERVGTGTPDIHGVQQVEVRFGIAGAEPWEGSVSVDHGTPPDPVATVPWKDTPKPPGEAMTEPPPNGTKLPLAALHPTIEALPQSVRRGETIHYWVRVTDMASGGEPTSLDPCPGFVQFVQFLGSQHHAPLLDEHYVNCDAAPPSIAPGTSIRLDMQLTIPTDAPLGNTSLTWKLGKLDFTGSESAFATVFVTE